MARTAPQGVDAGEGAIVIRRTNLGFAPGIRNVDRSKMKNTYRDQTYP